MKKISFILGLAVSLFSCSNLKTVSSVNNFDDAYFSETDLNKKGTYYSKSKDAPLYNAELKRESGTSSYGQTYSDRLRNFGNSSIQQPARSNANCNVMPNMMMSRGCGMMGYGYNPYMGYNSYNGCNPYSNFNSFGYGYGWNNPYMGYNPYGYMNQDPYWMYYNQMYNPWFYYGGNQFSSGWNNWSGGGSGTGGSGSGWATGSTSSKPKSDGFTNTGVRRNSYNTGTGSSSGGSTWSGGTTPHNTTSGSSGYNYGGGRSNSWSGGSTGFSTGSGSSGARSSSWGGSSSSSGSSGSQSGSSGRRR